MALLIVGRIYRNGTGAAAVWIVAHLISRIACPYGVQSHVGRAECIGLSLGIAASISVWLGIPTGEAAPAFDQAARVARNGRVLSVFIGVGVYGNCSAGVSVAIVA